MVEILWIVLLVQAVIQKNCLKFRATKVVALDRDSQVIELANKLKDNFQSRFVFYNKKFSKIDHFHQINLML